MRGLRSLLGNLRRSVLKPIARVAGDLLGLVPALLAGAGVFLVVAGLFNYLQPVAAAPGDTPAASPTISAAPYSLPPMLSMAPSGSGSVQAAIATRIRIQALGIDLPIVASPPHEEFPLCDVAEFMTFDKPAAYPGLPQATYLYAHARAGMFLPLLTASQTDDGAAMLGMWVEVFTDDDQRHIYEIKRVLRHVSGSAALDAASAATTDQLWLQTSEGPYASSTKLQIYAEPVGVVAATSADAHPPGHGSVCPKAPKCQFPDGTGCTPA
jgi:hypothetical protein